MAFEANALSGGTIDIWGTDFGVAVATKTVGTLLVGADPEDIRERHIYFSFLLTHL
jgi:hypothetical protein